MKDSLKKVLNWWPMFLLVVLAIGLGVGSCSHTRTKAEIDEDKRIINELCKKLICFYGTIIGKK